MARRGPGDLRRGPLRGDDQRLQDGLDLSRRRRRPSRRAPHLLGPQPPAPQPGRVHPGGQGDTQPRRPPRRRKTIMTVPFGQGRPIWVDAHDFDLNYHVRLTALPKPGNEEQLKTLMGRLQSTVLDRRRPLWELWFVEGLEGDRVAIIQKTHHALVDGISGVDVATVLLDFEPDPDPVKAPTWTPKPPPTPMLLLRDSLVERVTVPAEMIRS